MHACTPLPPLLRSHPMPQAPAIRMHLGIRLSMIARSPAQEGAEGQQTQ